MDAALILNENSVVGPSSANLVVYCWSCEMLLELRFVWSRVFSFCFHYFIDVDVALITDLLIVPYY